MLRVKPISLVLVISILLTLKLSAQQAAFQSIDFRNADSVAGLYPRHSLRSTKELADKLTQSFATESEKFRAIFTWVCLNIGNDYELYISNKRKREKLRDNPQALQQWNDKFSVRVFDRLTRDYKTVCTGYAYLVKELAYHAGLQCKIIDGYGRTVNANIKGDGNVNHSWNAVRIDSTWYLCDPTWSSGVIDLQARQFVKKFDTTYFLTDPTLFVRNHYPVDTSWLLLKNKPSLTQFLNRPLVYSPLFQYEVTGVYPETFEITTDKRKAVSFKFEGRNLSNVKNLTLQINGHSVSPSSYTDTSGFYCFDHTFNVKGIYTVHVLFDSAYVCSYTIKVK